eukprot:125202-Amphidinium_carterae.1
MRVWPLVQAIGWRCCHANSSNQSHLRLTPWSIGLSILHKVSGIFAGMRSGLPCNGGPTCGRWLLSFTDAPEGYLVAIIELRYSQKFSDLHAPRLAANLSSRSSYQSQPSAHSTPNHLMFPALFL